MVPPPRPPTSSHTPAPPPRTAAASKKRSPSLSIIINTMWAQQRVRTGRSRAATWSRREREGACVRSGGVGNAPTAS